jgi:superfamily II DNA/RNA helicase
LLTGAITTLTETREIGREKLDLLLSWIRDQQQQDPALKLIVWCRFRAELLRLRDELAARQSHVYAIHGDQPQHERELAIRMMDPRTSPASESVILLGTLGTGARGLTLTASHTVVYLSNDFRYGTYVQSVDRTHRPSQVSPVSYFDVVATGPQGQRTIDHAILAARAKKQNLSDLTTAGWVTLLKDAQER